MNNITFGKNTAYILDIDNTTVHTLDNFSTVSDNSLSQCFDSSDAVIFNTGRPSFDVLTILDAESLGKTDAFVTRHGSAIWQKTEGTQEWKPNQKWNSIIESSGFNYGKLRTVMDETINKYKKSDNEHGFHTIDYSEQNSLGYRIECPISHPDMPRGFMQEIKDGFAKVQNRGVLVNEEPISPTDSHNRFFINVKSSAADKKDASEFVLREILCKKPNINKVLIAGDSLGDLTNFLVSVPPGVKKLCALVENRAQNVFQALFDSKKLPLPKQFPSGNIAGYYPQAGLLVSGLDTTKYPAPAALKEAIRFFAKA